MTEAQYPIARPERVTRALLAAEQLGFPGACGWKPAG
jgi:hypothetical protein